MQTFSGMQRNLLNQNALTVFTLLIVFVVYEALSSIYLLLPPLLGLLFFLFIRALKEQQLPQLLLISGMLIILEAEKGYLFTSTLFYFSSVYYLVLPKVSHYINCKSCMKFIYIFLAYIGYWFFAFLMHQMLWTETPVLDWYVIAYILIEFIIVSLL